MLQYHTGIPANDPTHLRTHSSFLSSRYDHGSGYNPDVAPVHYSSSYGAENPKYNRRFDEHYPKNSSRGYDVSRVCVIEFLMLLTRGKS